MGQVEKRTCINQHSRRAVVYKLMPDYLSCINIIQWRIPGPVCLWQLLAVDDLVGNLQTPLININRCIRWINVWEKKIANIYSKPTMSLKWTGFFFFRKLLDNGSCNERILYSNKHFTCSTLCVQHILIAMRTMQLIQFVYFQYRIYLFSTWDKLFRRWVAWYQIGIKIQKNRRNEPTRYHLHISRFFISSKWTTKLLFWLFYLPFLVWFYRMFTFRSHRAHIWIKSPKS